jgi:hypothetical protein
MEGIGPRDSAGALARARSPVHEVVEPGMAVVTGLAFASEIVGAGRVPAPVGQSLAPDLVEFGAGHCFRNRTCDSRRA